MNSFQSAYLVAILALAYPAWTRQRFALICLWGNFAAMLASSLAMDIGALSPADARVNMMIVDLVTGVALAMRPGLARVIAAGYALTVPIYVPLISGFFTRGDADFTIVYIVSALQIGALAFGTFGDHSGGGKRRGFSSRRVPLAISLGGDTVLPGHVSAHSGEDLEVR